MNAFRKAAAIGMTVCICSAFFAGCRSKEKSESTRDKYATIDPNISEVSLSFIGESEDRSVDTSKLQPHSVDTDKTDVRSADEVKDLWVERLSSTFTDDHFEYKETSYGSLDGSEVIVHARSEKYPDQDVVICEDISPGGTTSRLVTNYNAVRYSERMEEYLRGILEERFNCDSLEVRYPGAGFTPVENMGFEKFLQNYAYLTDLDIILYRKDGAFTEDDQMVEAFIAFAKEQEETCQMYLYCCKEKTDDPLSNCICQYRLSMYGNGYSGSLYLYKDGETYKNETW